MSIKPRVSSIDYRWSTKKKLGLQARLVVTFTIIMIGFPIMLLFGCFHPKRLKPIKKQIYIGTGVTASIVATTKPLMPKSIHFGESRAVTKKKHHGAKMKEAKKNAALRSRQMRVVRAKRLRRDRERREQVAFIYQDVYSVP